MADNPGNAAAPDGARQPVTARVVIGWLLLIPGMLLTGGSGLCTGLFTIMIAINGGSGPELSGDGMFLIPLIYGGPVILFGALLWWIGVLVRGRRRRAALPSATEPPASPS